MVFQYHPGDSWFHRLDPLSKFVWVLSVSLLALRYEQATIQAVVWLAVVLKGLFWAGLSLRTLWRGVRLPFWFGLPYFVLQLLFLPGQTVLLTVGTWALTAEALDYAAAVSLRLLTLVLASLLFVATTDPRDIVLALAQRRMVPYRFAFAVSIALRFLPVLEAESAQIRAAQRLRGFTAPRGWRNRLEWRKRFVLSLFANAVRRVQQTAEAMEVRGFGAYPDRTYRRTLDFPLSGRVLSAFSILFTIGALFIF